MSTRTDLAFVNAMVESGELRLGDYITCGDIGVLFRDEHTARIFAERHGKDLEPVAIADLTAWLARNRMNPRFVQEP